MFHACVQRFDGMDEKILGGKLNRALEFWWAAQGFGFLDFLQNTIPKFSYLLLTMWEV